MNTKLKILLAAILFTAVITREKICKHLGFGQAESEGNHIVVNNRAEPSEKREAETNNYLINNFCIAGMSSY